MVTIKSWFLCDYGGLTCVGVSDDVSSIEPIRRWTRSEREKRERRQREDRENEREESGRDVD